MPLDLQRWFAERSLDDARARLAEAGGGVGTEILLSDVFVDLVAEHEGADRSALALVTGALPTRSRALVVFGGPGEGKSSLTAMAALLLRASWVDAQPDWPPQLSQRYRRLSESLRARLEQLDAASRGTIPLRVDLPSFVTRRARQLEATGDSLSFWQWTAEQCARCTGDEGWTAERLEAALRAAGRVRWLLDGLDEVAPGPARDALVESIAALAATSDSVVVTSRPQGYERAIEGFGDCVLQPLEPSQAQAIATRLTAAWADGNDADTALRKVTEALDDREVADVARTALHVTLIAVVALTRELPSNRAALFELFFQTLFRRELAKKGAADITEADEPLLLGLHTRAGLTLHALSQFARNSAPLLSEAECASALVALLSEFGFDPEYARRRASALLRFSQDRLVLLRRLHSDGFAFGVRSFQEYFAARALVDGDDDAVSRRIATAALDPYWSNVVELSACELLRAKNKSEQERAKRALVGACEQSQLRDAGSSARSPLGASLALWMLEATRSIPAPWAQNALFVLAFDAIDAGPPLPLAIGRRGLHFRAPLTLSERLSLVAVRAHEATREPWRSRLIERARSLANEPRSRSLWALLWPLLDGDVREAMVLARALEGERADEAQALFDAMPAGFPWTHCEWGRDFLARRWPHLLPLVTASGDARIRFAPEDVSDDEPARRDALDVHCVDGVLRYEPTFGPRGRVRVSDSTRSDIVHNPQWNAARSIQALHDAPSRDALVRALRAVLACGEQFVRALLNDTALPWTLAACLTWAGNAARCESLIARIDAGELGDERDWSAFEDRVVAITFTVQELVALDPSEVGPWSRDIAMSGTAVISVANLSGVDVGPPTVRAERCTPLTWTLMRRLLVQPFAPDVEAAFLAEHPWLAPQTERELAEARQRDDLRWQRGTVDDPSLAQFKLQLPLEATWRELGLPGVSPERARQQLAPQHITAIETLSGVRAFATTPAVRGELPAPRPDEGQWIVLLGENGTGKSTLLRALALALIERETATKLLTARLRLLRAGEDGRVRVTVNGAPFEARIHRTSEGEEAIEALAPAPMHRPWVVAYGVRRSTALGEPDRGAELRGTANLHSLFELPGSLVYAPTWLSEQYKLVLSERDKNRKEKLEPEYKGPDERAWVAIERAFDALLRIREIDASGRELFVTHRDFGRVRFDQLSDGYLTTAGWLVDLVARWIAHHALVALPEDILGNITGLVLVDEIDLHLHPLWQMRIIDDVRRLFPKLSFVVTTHNPLTVHGAKRGEVFVLRREATEGARPTIVLEQRDVRAGSDVDRVLFDLFGVRDTLDSSTRSLLDQHLALLRSGATLSDPKRLALEQTIRDRLGAGGTALLDQRGARVAPTDQLSEEEQRNAVAWFGEEE